MGRESRRIQGKSMVKSYNLGPFSFVPFYVQVIHLVRDPRGVLASMLRRDASLLTHMDFFKDYCNLMLDDLTMSKSMPRSR